MNRNPVSWRAGLALAALALTTAPRAAAQSDPWAFRPEFLSQAIFSCGDAKLNGHAAVDSTGASGAAAANQGHVVSNGTITLDGGATIRGNATAGTGLTVTLNGGATVTGTTGTLATPWSCAPVDLTTLAQTVRTANDNASIGRTSKGNDPLRGSGRTDLVLNGNESLTIPAGTYFFTSIKVEGGSSLTFSGAVRVLCTGTIKIAGNSLVNAAGRPFDLRLFTSGSAFSLESKAELRAVLYASSPAAEVAFKGGARFTGSHYGGRVTLDGGAAVTRTVDDFQPLAILISDSGNPIVDGALFGRAVTPVVTASGGVQPVETVSTLDGDPFSSGTEVSIEGTHHLAAAATDFLGRQVSRAVSFTIDRTAPPLVVLRPSAGSALASSPVDVYGTSGDAVSVTVNGLPATVGGGAFTVRVPLAEGPGTLTVVATDAAGNPATVLVPVVLDTQLPSLGITAPADGAVVSSTTVPVTGTVSDATPVTVTVNGSAATVGSGTFSATVSLVEGPNPITVVAIDAAGNTSSGSLSVDRDTTAPTIRIDDQGAAITDGAVLRRDVTPVITVTDAHPATTSVTLDGDPFVSGTTVVAEGLHTLLVDASDAAGNTATRSVRFTIDKTPPPVAITRPATGTFVDAIPSPVEGTCGDAVSVTVNGIAASVASGAFTIPAFPFAEGAVTLTAVAVDAAGNDATATSSVTVDTLPPQVAITQPAAGSILGPGPIFVRGTASDATLQSVSVDGSPAGLSPDGTFEAGPLARPDGPATFTATATDRTLKSSSAAVSVVVDTVPPVLTIADAATGQPIVDGAYFAGPVTLSVTATDATTPSQTTKSVTVDGNPYAGGPIPGEGVHRVDARATDGAENVATATLGFTIDTTPPAFSDLSPADGLVTASAGVTVSGRVSTDAVEVTVNGQRATLAGGAFSLSGLTLVEGENTFALRAVDRAGNPGTATLRLVLDTIPPTITITSPAAGALLGNATISVTGTVSDPNLDTVTVEGGVAPVSGGTFRRDGVTLPEGPSTLTATARDKAGNTTPATVSVTVDTKAPVVSITAPTAGTVLGASPASVSGTASDAHLASVTVNGVAAAIDGTGRFTADVPLAEGSNTLVATARDTLGHDGTAQVTVSLDTAAPVVTISSPTDGARLRQSPLTVSGTLDSATNVSTVTVNGVAATLAGTSFTAEIPLLEGSNPITARATKTTGKEGTAGITVVLDTTAPRLLSSSPADGQSGVSLTPELRLTFSEAIDPASAPAQAFTLATGTEPAVPVSVTVADAVVTLVPQAALLDSSPYVLTTAAGLTDLAGNALVAPAPIRFTTVDQTAPSAPVLDPVSTLLCAQHLTLQGSAEPGTTVAVAGGASAAQTTSGTDGRFSVEVPLSGEIHQTLSVTSRDAAGNVSPATSVSLTVDCTPPQVLDVVRAADSVTVLFDEAIDPASARLNDTVRIDRTPGDPIPATLALSADGTTLTLTVTGLDLTATGFTLALSSSVTDLAGNDLPPFVRTFAPLTQSTVLLGEVYDDAIGRPLPGATATLLLSGGVSTPDPQPIATTTASGVYSLPAVTGEAIVRLSAPGYLPVHRREVIQGDSTGQPFGATLFDARLTPIAEPASRTSTPDGSTFTAPASGSLLPAILSAPAGSLPEETVVRITVRRPQGLPVLAPLGWSVAAAANVACADASGTVVTPTGTMTLTLPDLYGAQAATHLTLVHLDPASLQWIAEGTAQLGSTAGRIELPILAAGDWAALVPDAAPGAPPVPALGSPIEGVALPDADPLESATVAADPVDVHPSQTADVSLTVTSPTPVPSGFPVQTLVTEELTLADGAVVSAPSFLSDLVLLRRGDGTTGLSIPVRASEAAQRVALSVGYERFAVKKFPFEVRRGTVVGPAGGTVVGASGWSVTLSAGAVATATSLTLTPLSAGELPATIPAAFELLGAVDLGTGGLPFSLPATLALRLSTPPAAGRDLLLVAFEEKDGLVLLRPVARAAWDEASLSVRSLPIDRAVFPWPGAKGEGTFAFVSAIDPLAYVSGRVLDVDGAGLSAAVVTAGSWPLVAVTESGGTFALAIRAAATTLSSVHPLSGNAGSVTVAPSAQGQELTGIELRLAVTAPWVVSVSPAPGSTILVSTRFTVELSEAVDPFSVTAESFFLMAPLPGGNPGQAVLVPGLVDVAPGGRILTFAPSGLLPGSTQVVLGLSRTVRDRNGYGLVDAASRQPSDFAATFTTEDTSPPDTKPWLVTIGMPQGDPNNPTVTITGGPGAVCPGCHVVATNETTQATASTDALSDGSFTLTLFAKSADRIRIEVEKPNGTKQTLPAVAFTSDGGRTAIVGRAGGLWETPEGTRISVPEGAFDAPVSITTRRVEAAAFDQIVAPPRDMSRLDAFTMEFDTNATEGFNLSFPAPATPGLTDQFFLAQVVEVFGEKRLMVVDILYPKDGRLTTDRKGDILGTLASQGKVVLLDQTSGVVSTKGGVTTFSVVPSGVVSPNDAVTGGQINRPASYWDGAWKRGYYAMFNASTQMVFAAGPSLMSAMIATSSVSDFLFAGTDVLTSEHWRLVTPAGRPFDLTLTDGSTGLVLSTWAVTDAPTDPSRMTLIDPPLGSDGVPPAVVAISPGRIHRFQVPAIVAPGSDGQSSPALPVAPGITVATSDYVPGTGGNPATVQVTVTGAPGSVPKGSTVRFYDVSRPVKASTTAGSDGALTVSLLAVRPGDRLSLVVDATNYESGRPLVIKFDKFVKAPSADAWKSWLHVREVEPPPGRPRIVDGDVLVDGDVFVDGAWGTPTQSVTFQPNRLFERGAKYKVTIDHRVEDPSGLQLADDFEFGFGSPGPGPIATQTGGYVRKVLTHGGLVLETGEDNRLHVYPAGRLLQTDIRAECFALDLPGVGQDMEVDRFGRLVVLGGGTDSLGFVKMYDFGTFDPDADQDPSSHGEGCGEMKRTLEPAGVSMVSDRLGGDFLAYPPPGVPRRIRLVQPVESESWTVGRDDLPPGWQLSGDTQIGYGRPYGIRHPDPFPRDPEKHDHRMVSLKNLMTGETVVARPKELGPYPPLGCPDLPECFLESVELGLERVSRGDRLVLEVSNRSIGIVDLLGYGMAFVDIENVHFPGSDGFPSAVDSRLRGKLFLTYNGSSPALGLPCLPSNCDTLQRCAVSGPVCELFAAPYENEKIERLTNLIPLTDIAVDARGASNERFRLFGAVNGVGLATFDVDLAARPRGAWNNEIREGHPVGLLDVLVLDRPENVLLPSRAVAVVAAPGFPKPQNPVHCTSRWWRWRDEKRNLLEDPPKTKDLVFVAGGVNGVWVVDASEDYPPEKIGRLETAGGASTLSLDVERKLLYVGDAGSGVKVFSVGDPCDQALPLLSNGDDPRLVGSFQFGPGGEAGGVANLPVEIDPDTALIWAGANLVDTQGANVGVYTAGPPPLFAVADTDLDGVLERIDRIAPLGVPNPDKVAAIGDDPTNPKDDPSFDVVELKRHRHKPYRPDHFRVLAFLPGEVAGELIDPVTGQSVKGVEAEVASTGPEGADPAPLPQGFPKVEYKGDQAAGNRAVVLRRQSDDPASPAFNRFLSDPIVVLADARAQLAYQRHDDEKTLPDSKGLSNPNACINCDLSKDVAEVVLYQGSLSEPQSAKRHEIWAGDRIRIRFTESLKDRLPYLRGEGTEVDLKANAVLVRCVRGDLTPSLQQAPRINSSAGLSDAADVTLHDGELRSDAVDLVVRGRGLDFSLGRSYRSRALHDSPLGRGWDSPLFARLRFRDDGAVDFYDGTGRRDTFTIDADKKYAAPAGLFASLDYATDGFWYLKLKDKTLLRFDPNGRLHEIWDRVTTTLGAGKPDGNRIRFVYDGAGRLVSLLDTLDHPILLEYFEPGQETEDGFSLGKLRKVTDHTKRTVEYRYDGEQRLRSVRHPELKTISEGLGTKFEGDARPVTTYGWADVPANAGPDPRRLLFEPDNLKTMSNRRGTQILAVDYGEVSGVFGFGAAESVNSETIGGKRVLLTYEKAEGSEAIVARVTDRRGHVTEIRHDEKGRPTKVTLVDNGIGDSQSSPLHSVSPEFPPPSPIVTSFFYKSPQAGFPDDGLLDTVTLPGGQTQVATYPTDAGRYGLKRRKAGNLAGLTVSNKGKSLTTTAEYDEVTNSLRKLTEPGSIVTQVDLVPGKGLPAGVTYPSTANGIDANGEPKGVDVKEGFKYDDREAKGELHQITDASGTVHSLDYFGPDHLAAGYLQSFTEDLESPTPAATGFDRDARGNAKSVTDPRGVRTEYVVDEYDRVVEERLGTTAPNDGGLTNRLTRKRVFDKDGNLEKLVETDGTTTKSTVWHYDDLGRPRDMVQSGDGADPKTTTYEYDSTGNLVGVTDAGGAYAGVAYDGRGLPVAARRVSAIPAEPGTSTVSLDRDLNGNVLRESDGLNTVTDFAYDDLDRLVSTTSPRGAVEILEYDAASRIKSRTTKGPAPGSFLFRQETYSYAPSGDRTLTTVAILPEPEAGNPREYTLSVGYDPRHLPLVISELNRETTRGYDARGRLILEKDPFGNQSIHGYDAVGNRTSTTVVEAWPTAPENSEPQRSTTRVKYDGLGFLRETAEWDESPLKRTTTFARDGFGRATDVTDTRGVVTHSVFDRFDRLVSKTEALGSLAVTTGWTYNAWDRIRVQTDAELRETRWGYDGLGRNTSTTWADGKSRSQTFHLDGTLETATDERGNKLRFTYGPDDRLEGVLRVESAPGLTGFTQEMYQYDVLGRLFAARSDSGIGGAEHVSSRTYDSRDLVLTETEDGRTLVHDYDTLGNRVRTTFPERTSGEGRVLERTYDPRNILASLTMRGVGETNSSAVVSYEPRGLTRYASAQRPALLTVGYGYDDRRRLTDLRVARGGGPEHLGLGYGWGQVDQLLSETRRHEGTLSDVYGYDDLYRVTSVGFSQISTAAPDLSVANVLDLTLQKTHDIGHLLRRVGGVTTDAETTRTPRHQYAQFSGQAMAWDDSGNRIADANATYGWDARGRLVSATKTDGTVVEYGYDPLGRRVERRVVPGGEPTASSTSRFVYDGWELVQDWTCTTGCDQASGYVLSREYVPTDALDRPLEVLSYPPAGPPSRHLLFGNLAGSIALVTDESGRPEERIRYFGSGEPSFDSPVTVERIGAGTAVGGGSALEVVFRYALNPATVNPENVRLLDASGAPLDVTLTPGADGRTITVASTAALVTGAHYRVALSPALTDAWGGTNGVDSLVEFVHGTGSPLFENQQYRLGNASALGLTRLWQGLEYEPQLGLYYARHRFYDPRTGAFLSADPLGFPDGPNQFTWPYANGWKQDPLGLQQELTPNLVELQRSRNETVTALEQLGIAAGATRDLATIALYMGPGIRDVLLTGEVIDAFERGDPLSVGPQVALRSLALLRYINLTRPESLAAISAARRAGGGRVDVSELRVPRNPSAALEALDDAGDLRLAAGSTGASTGAATRGAGKVTGLVQDAEGLKALGWIKPAPGEFAMVVHGTEKGESLFKVLKRGGKAANPADWLTVSHRQIATVMRKAGYRSGEKVRLYTCRGGACPTGIAQDLANKLGAEVEAPSDTLWVSRTGRTTIGPKPGVDTGHWEQFRPVRPAQ